MDYQQKAKKHLKNIEAELSKEQKPSVEIMEEIKALKWTMTDWTRKEHVKVTTTEFL